jgi:hypothetical protein
LIVDAEGGSRFAVRQLRESVVDWDGLEEPPTADNVIVTLRDYQTLENIFAWLASGRHPFRSVVFDSLTEIQQRCMDMVNPGVGQAQQQQWGEILRRMSQMIRQYRDIVIKEDGNPLKVVVFIAISRERNGKMKPVLQGQLADTYPQWVDLIGYLKVERDFEGNVTRSMNVQPEFGIEAKDRTDVFDDIIVTPNISEMFDYLTKELASES